MNDHHFVILKRGVLAWNEWREANQDILPDLSGAFLRGMDLRNVNFRNTNLSCASLRNAHLRNADLRFCNLTGADLTESFLLAMRMDNACLRNANMRRAQLIETSLRGADLSGALVYGVSAWNVQVDSETNQTGLVVSPADENKIAVDSIELAQFLFLILSQGKLRDVINSITKRGVLILGRFGDGGIDTLRLLADKLRELHYLPIIFDFERPDNRDFTETIKTLVGLSRFVVVDLSGPSVPQELYATIPHYKIPFIPILEKGRHSWSMFTDLLGYDWVIQPIIEFDNASMLLTSVSSEIVKRAEEKVEERQALLNELFPPQC